MRVSTTLALATGAAAQNSSQFLASNPGGAVPASVQVPSTHGFMNPTVQPSRGGLAVCVSGIIPVKAAATNMKFKFQAPQNQSQVTATELELLTSGSPFMQQIMGGMQNVSGTYNISATYCTPANNTKPSTVEVLTHGIGFDRYYWDFAPGYSYIDVATQYNHATFFYDRLGVGQSSKPDGISVIQSPLEANILHQLITKLKAGSISNGTFSTVIGTGHSYGSILTQAITSMHPTDISTAILTGFSMNSTGMPPFMAGLNLQIAANNSPYRFSGLNTTYLIAGDASGVQLSFMRAPNFDPQILNLATATAGTVTWGEFFTTMAVVAPAKNYTGGVAIVNGANDLAFCTGNCTYPTNIGAEALKMLYPMAARTDTYYANVTGHGLNLHYSAVAAYHYIQGFIANSSTPASY